MSNRLDAARLQPILIGVALVAAVLAALALLLHWQSRDRASRPRREHMAALSALVAEHPAAGGRRGARLGAGLRLRWPPRAPARATLVDADARQRLLGTARCSGDQAGWAAMLEQSQAVLDGRAAALDRRSRRPPASAISRPQVLAADRQSSPRRWGRARPDAFSRQLERFELRAQAVEQDLAALADGTASVEAASRRLADSLDFMGAGRRRADRRAATRSASSRRGAGGGRGAGCSPPSFRSEQQQVRAVIALGDSARADAGRAQCARRERRPGLHASLGRSGIGAGRRRPRPGSRARGCRCASAGARCSRLWRGCVSLQRVARAAAARPPTCRPRRTSATSRRSCGCSTSCRASPTAT